MRNAYNFFFRETSRVDMAHLRIEEDNIKTDPEGVGCGMDESGSDRNQ
jgi:hypothetical protein